MEAILVILFAAYAAMVLLHPVSPKVTIRLARLVTIISAFLLFYLAKQDCIMPIPYIAMAICQLLICLFTPLVLDEMSNQ